METSDSEYFESADEEIESDEEDTRTIKSVDAKAEQSLKNLKIEDTVKGDSLDKNKNVKASEGNNILSAPCVEDEENNKTVKTEQVQVVNQEDSKEVNENVVDKTLSQAPIIEYTDSSDKTEEKPFKEPSVKPKLGSKLAEKRTSDKEIKPSKLLERDTTKEPEIKPNQIEEPEENLWDDEEIDWGKECEAKSNDMWDNDEWEPLDELKETPQQHQQSDNTASWGSWSNWGVSKIVSTATQGVSTLTQGISTVLESGIGVPDPEELARINKAEREKKMQSQSDENKGENKQDDSIGFAFNNLVMGVSHITKFVETTGTKVISGGLDTLETIGKKTMEVLQEGDPGLKKKRAFLKIDQDKPVLSQLLREAKEKAEQENRALEEKHFRKKAKNYETLFDDHQGLVHLEALEMLSKQCDIKLQNQLESADENLNEIQETMEQVKELCELPDEDDEEQLSLDDIKEKLENAVRDINIPITYKKLIETWEETETWLNNLKLEVCNEKELHQQAIETLAQLTAIAVEQYHKAGELLLIKEHRSTADEADSLVQLTTTLTSLIGVVAAKFSDKLNIKSANAKNKEEVNGLITNVFLEAANSSSYIQDAFQLLIPVLQVGAV